MQRVIAVNLKMLSVVTVQTIHSGYPDKADAILRNIIDDIIG